MCTVCELLTFHVESLLGESSGKSSLVPRLRKIQQDLLVAGFLFLFLFFLAFLALPHSQAFAVPSISVFAYYLENSRGGIPSGEHVIDKPQ